MNTEKTGGIQKKMWVLSPQSLCPIYYLSEVRKCKGSTAVRNVLAINHHHAPCVSCIVRLACVIFRRCVCSTSRCAPACVHSWWTCRGLRNKSPSVTTPLLSILLRLSFLFLFFNVDGWNLMAFAWG